MLTIVDYETIQHDATNDSEDYLGLDEEATGHDPLENNSTSNEDNGEDQKARALPSTTSPADTDTGLDHVPSQASTPGTVQSLTAPAIADDFDDIGYSDEEDDEPSNISTPITQIPKVVDFTPIKPSSPKRSIDEVDDSTSKCRHHNLGLQS